MSHVDAGAAMMRQMRDNRSSGVSRRSCLWVVLAAVGVVVVVLVVIVAQILSALNEEIGGTAYTAMDSTVSAARAKVIETMRLEVDHMVTTISPGLGQPTLRAVFDECRPASSGGYTNNIDCERTDYLFYPAASEPKDFRATELSPLLAASEGWVPLTDNCDARAGQARVCLTRNGDSLGVVQNLPSSDPDYRISLRYAIPKIDETGYAEFTQTVIAVPGVYVAYTASYFSG